MLRSLASRTAPEAGPPLGRPGHNFTPYTRQESSETPNAPHSPRSAGSPFIPRLIIFLLLETGFILLSARCLLNPISLPLPNNNNIMQFAKAFTTAITVMWHALSVLIAEDLTVCVFSSECMEQYRRTGKLIPGETDRVSTITTGLLSHLTHFMSRTATARYRVAFAASVVLMALGPIGPAVLSVNLVPVQVLKEIQLSNLTTTGDNFNLDPLASASVLHNQPSERAKSVLRMEIFENQTIGYRTTEERILIPWPQPGLESEEGAIRYWTDIITYNYNCSWSPPVPGNATTLFTDLLGNTTTANGQNWTFIDRRNSRILGPQEGFDMIMPFISERDSVSSAGSASAFLFLGGPAKSTYGRPVNHNLDGLDLANIPSIPFLYGDSDDGERVLEFRASFLLCEPQLEIFPGEVLFKQGVLHLTQKSRRSSLIGNIQAYSASIIFAQALFAAVLPDMGTNDIERLTDHSISLFLDSSRNNAGGGRKLLPLTKINENMNSRLQIAAKAYLAGSVINNSSNVPSRSWTLQNGTIELQKPALIASKPFWVTLVTMVATLMVLMSSLVIMMQRRRMQLFDLHGFMIKGAITDKLTPLSGTVPPGYRTSRQNLPDKAPSIPHRPRSTTRATFEILTLRLVIFVLLETSFIILGIRCFLNPIALPLPSFIVEIKALTTAIAVVWHTLAAFAVKDLAVRAFSAECITQHRLTGTLKPGETDRVSTITTGYLSHARHLVAHSTTARYRTALVAVIVIMILGTVGPSAITVSSISIRNQEEIQLSNLTLTHTMELSPSTGPTNESASSGRAEFVLRMETLENYTFGYRNTEERLLVPWPQLGLESREGAMTYLTDVVAYNYDCSWNPPSPDNSTFSAAGILFGQTVTAGGQMWKTLAGLQRSFFHPKLRFGMIVPLTAAVNSSASTSPTAAFMFWGTPAGPDSAPSNITSVDLTNIPSSHSFLVDGLNNSNVAGEFRASVLLCKPRLRIFPGEVHLERGVLHLVQPLNRSSPIGNIPTSAANVISSQALMVATQPGLLTSDSDHMSNFAVSLFLDQPQNSTSGLRKTLALGRINENMNSHLQIAAKAYLSGAITAHSDDNPLRRSTAQNATSENLRPALTVSKPFLASLIITVGVLTVLLLRLLLLMQRVDMELFNLENLTIREKLGPAKFGRIRPTLSL